MNGKGSQRRGCTKAERIAYEQGWERIFGRGKKRRPKKKGRT